MRQHLFAANVMLFAFRFFAAAAYVRQTFFRSNNPFGLVNSVPRYRPWGRLSCFGNGDFWIIGAAKGRKCARNPGRVVRPKPFFDRSVGHRASSMVWRKRSASCLKAGAEKSQLPSCVVVKGPRIACITNGRRISGKKRLASDGARQATSGEVKELHQDIGDFKEALNETLLENRLLKKTYGPPRFQGDLLIVTARLALK